MSLINCFCRLGVNKYSKSQVLNRIIFSVPSKLFSKKRSNNGEKVPEIVDDPGWITANLGSSNNPQKSAMDDRLEDAKQWVSRKLSDEEASIFNRALGIEAEVLAATNAINSPKKSPIAKNKKSIAEMDEQEAAAKMRGFLELNPYVCSGCGAPFQSKSTDSPGFLPKEKLQEHRSRAELIRGKQDAIKILEMAGIEIDSPAAEEILRSANVSPEVVAGVRQFGQENKAKPVVKGTTTTNSKGSSSSQGDSRSKTVSESKVRSSSATPSLSSVQLNTNDDDDDEYDEDDLTSSISLEEEDDELEDDEDEIDEDDIDEDDPLDGLEFDLDEIFGSMSDEDDKEDLGSALAKAINKKTMETSTSISVSTKITGNKKTGNINIHTASDSSSDNVDLSRNVVNDITEEIQQSQRPKRTLRSYLRNSDRSVSNIYDNTEIDVDMNEIGSKILFTDPETLNTPSNVPSSDSICVCQRCYRLQQYGQVEETLRPGWSKHELLTPEHFEQLLGVIKETEGVVLCLIDVFDLQGSILPNLKKIAGPNPIVIAANKFDLLPIDTSAIRLTGWIHDSVKKICDLKSPKEAEEEVREEMRLRGWYRPKDKKEVEAGILRRNNIHLVSCQSGVGMDALLASVMGLAQTNGKKVYVMGAANVGKSSFINKLLDYGNNNKKPTTLDNKKLKSKDIPQATVSNLPGTTLDFLRIKLPNGITMIDTPGLINKGQLTSRINTAELRQIIPNKRVNAVTLRVTEGKCVLIGGIARIELTEGRPFFFTFFISNEVKLHPTDIENADNFLLKHTGTLISPPVSYERVQQLGPYESQSFEITGEGWKKSEFDIVIAGLGWIAITGPGLCKVNVVVPEGTSVSLRPSLMPFEAKASTVSFTGGRLLRKSGKSGGKNFGWRA